MPTRLLLAIAAALLILRVPSLAQPMGPDQGLYAYVGDRILHGELAYRDAWDQKPPGIHYVYAALRAISHRDVIVPAADLAAAAAVAMLLWRLGTLLAGPIAGGVSAVIFLLLSDPSFARYGGVRVRAQCETFIALAVTGAIALALGATGARGAHGVEGAGAKGARGAQGATVGLLAAGVLIGVAFALKYNAGLYGLVVLAALALTSGLTLLEIAWILAGAAIVPVVLFVIFWSGGALNDLYQATIAYNVRYSGETYASRWDMVGYLIRFPVGHARVDALWFVGGFGCLVLLARGRAQRTLWLPVAWTAAACLSIAINGSRGLPQYFLQAAPALALAAGIGLTVGLAPLPRLLRAGLIALIAIGVWRAGSDPFPKLAATVWHDTQYVLGRLDRRAYLSRYGGAREADKYSALDNLDLGALLASTTSSADTVYVFGFSAGAYVYADRRSASRFFWSRPVILDFNHEDSRYGVVGLLADLQRTEPAMVILQQHDWSPDVQDSAPFFHSQQALDGWLRGHYHPIPAIDGFEAWRRNRP
ncbi:MAG TPA: hypothetical protein VN716_03915 [Vicinamibacterales bacterium]|nr:hypothetical protein [Vicinamibacterales bacterium]